MIREARFVDIPVIAGMLREMFAASKYVGRGEISEPAMEALLTGGIAQQHQGGPQGSHLAIAEQDGKAVGFILGVFDRVYHIGNKLCANDVYFHVRPGAGIRHSLGLVDSYIAWAEPNRKVIEIILSWSDAIPGAEKIAALARRKGFVKIGETFEIRCDHEMRRAA